MSRLVRVLGIVLSAIGMLGDGALAAPPTRSATEHEPEQIRISMEFENAPLKDVLKAFSKQTGINVIASKDIENRTITLYLEDVSAVDALDRILETGGLLYERPPGSEVYMVRADPTKTPLQGEAPAGAPSTKIYTLKYAHLSTSRLSRAVEASGSQLRGMIGSSGTSTAQGVTLGSSGGSGSGSASGGAGTSNASSGATGGAGSASELLGLDLIVQQLLTGQGSLVVDERTNSMIITDVPDNLKKIETVIEKLDVKTPQIMIETDLFESTLGTVRNLGVAWGTSSSITTVGLTPAKAATKFPFNTMSSTVNDAKYLTRAKDPKFTGTGQIELGVVEASQVIATLQALSQDTDTRILARPRVLTMNNESAVVRLQKNQAISRPQSVVITGGTVSNTGPERAPTGIVLVVTPQLNEDGSITMLVEPSVTDTVASEITTTTDPIVDPQTKSVRSLVRIRQGESLILGGLINRRDERAFPRVPGLSQIPVLGELFKQRTRSGTDRELIAMVTPRVFQESEVPGTGGAAAALGPARQDQIEQALTRLEQRRSL